MYNFFIGATQGQNPAMETHVFLSLDVPGAWCQRRSWGTIQSYEAPETRMLPWPLIKLMITLCACKEGTFREDVCTFQGPRMNYCLVRIKVREASGRTRFWLLVKAGEWSIRETIPVHNYYLLLLNNTICCAPIRSTAIYNIDMLLALPNQYLLLQTIEMTFVLYLPPVHIFKVEDAQSEILCSLSPFLR